MKRPGKAGGKDVRRPKAAGRKRGVVPKPKFQPRPVAADQQEQIKRIRQELNEALQQQAATSEVLQVISASPGDLNQAFDVILANATRLSGAKFGTLYLYDGSSFRTAATHNAPAAYVKLRMRGPIQPGPGTALDRVVRTKRPVHFPDITKEKAYRRGESLFVTAAKLGGYRSLLSVPMLQDGKLIGAIAMQRREVCRFTDKQIALVENFAAQAVIAIENARLLNELRQRTDDLTELLEQQTATSEVLRVISSSPGELDPVFQAMLENATRICDAKFGILYLYEGDKFRPAAIASASPEFEAFVKKRGTFRPHPKQPLGRVLQTKTVFQMFAGAKDGPGTAAFELGGAQAFISVPMLKETELIGAINIFRQERRPFTDRQISLVQNFAAQAVIAIENTRLLNELRQRTDDLTESLEQQTATADVLKVISRSTFDLQVVLETLIELAAKLCRADKASFRLARGELFHHVASFGYTAEQHRYMIEHPVPAKPDRGSTIGRVLPEGKAVQIEDTKADPEFRMTNVPGFENIHTTLGVPLLREGRPIGVLVLMRSRVERFTEKQIELVATFADQAVIALENVRLFEAEQQRTRELTESLEQQTATADVLRVISSSPGELEPVFQAMLENATRICEAKFGNLLLYDGATFRVSAIHGDVPEWIELRRRDPVLHFGPKNPLQRIVTTHQTQHTVDTRADEAYVTGDPSFKVLADLTGARTLLMVPMLKENELVGIIGIYRQQVRPFSDKQIALVQNFAAQAVIAIENTRLLNELRQSLEQQTATADVLRVISSSPGELEPVFQAMLANAARVCEAKFGMLFRLEDGAMRPVASLGAPEPLTEFFAHGPHRPSEHAPIMRVARTKQPVHVLDFATERAYVERNPVAVAAVELGGVRTNLIVPMLKENELVGAFSIFRQEVRPFTDKQIELVKNFAAQAVIAIENTRLLNELRQRTDDLSESLEQQTATSDVLKVISSSPGDLEPVFDAMLANATRICKAEFGTLYLSDGDSFRIATATRNAPPAYVEARKRESQIRPPPDAPLGRVATTKKIVQIPDLSALQSYRERHPFVVAAVELGGFRTALGVPMLKENELVGSITILRQEVRPFTDKQIALVQNFAAQAVIAIENTRLLNELRQRTDDLTELLEQQTATSEVLKVISSSPGELEPVFQSMLENATRICEAKFGNLLLYDGDAFRLTAVYGAPPAWAEEYRRNPIFRPTPDIPLGRVAATKRVVHVADVAREPSYAAGDPAIVPLVDVAGARSLVVVPMLKENELVGAFGIFRQEVRPFTDKQIDLVKNFASQAVIAIENTRLLNELRQRTTDLTESLEQQTATSEVLKVISRSTFELQVVLDTLVESAAKLCRADRAAIRLARDGLYHHAASHGFTPEQTEFMKRHALPVNSKTLAGRVILAGKAVHIPDSKAESGVELTAGSAFANVRTTLGAPLLREGIPIGVLVLTRSVVEPFTERQIELAATFADQAVIAIENTRLLNELRQRTDDLSESLEQQTATSEVLSVISSSPGELGPVFETLLSNAVRICGAKFGMLFLPEGNEAYRIVALHGAPPAFAESRRRDPVIRLNPATTLGRVAATKQVVQVEDVRADPAYTSDPTRSPLLELAGARTMLNVPMLKEDDLVGQIAIYRQEVRPFTDKQIDLVKNFAAQAVIAIENTRLLNELRQSLEQQTATADVLRVISSSPGELEPVFQALLANAVRICDAKYGTLVRYNNEAFDPVALFGASPELAEFIQRRGPFKPPAGAPLDRLLRTKDVVRVDEFSTDEAAISLARFGGARSLVAVPMLKEDALIGAIVIYRQEVRPFTEKQVELLTNFAASGRHRHREHAAAQRIAAANDRPHRVIRAADCDLGGIERHQFVARRAGTRISGHAGECRQNLPSQVRLYASVRWRGLPYRGLALLGTGVFRRDEARTNTA